MHKNTCFATCICFVDTNHRNLLKSFMTINKVAYIILRTQMGNCVCLGLAYKNEIVRRGLKKNESEWPTGKVKIRIREKSLAVGEACVSVC